MTKNTVPSDIRGWLVLTASLLSMLSVQGIAQEVNLPQRSVTFGVSAVGDSGLSGTLFVAEFRENLSVVVLQLDGTSAGNDHPSHLHTGDCGSGGGVEIPLADVAGDSGLGVTVVRMPYEDLLAQDFHANAHLSAAQMGTIVACGEVGEGAEAGAGVERTQAEAEAAQPPAEAGAAEGAPAEEPAGEGGAVEQAEAEAETEVDAQMGLRSDSYQIFAIQDSGVSGTLNVTEEVGGGTTFVVTGSGINPGMLYQPVLFAGDCGPDRERVAELPPIGAIPEDPFVSISQVSMSFDDVAEGDYFLYIYPEGGEGEPLACGEVGEAANR